MGKQRALAEAIRNKHPKCMYKKAKALYNVVGRILRGERAWDESSADLNAPTVCWMKATLI